MTNLTTINVMYTPEGKQVYKNNPLGYASLGASGFDLRASKDGVVKSHNTLCVPTGIAAQIEKGFEIQLRPRSGLALKHGVTVLNSPGTIDSDYRGEICAILHNTSDNDFTFKAGDRIAQAVVQHVIHVNFTEADSLEVTERNAGGFGSTGIK
jgi:dUTP pyrophosphatase